jgi:hypothetical protein
MSENGFSVLKSLGREDQVIIHACCGKHKRARASEQVTPELDAEQVFNAALALYELFSCVSSPLPVAVVSLMHVHWAWKRRRSSRSRKPDKLSDSSTTSSERQTVLDLFPSYNTPCIEVVQTGSDTMRQEDYMVTEERSRPIAGVGMDPDSDCRLQKPVLESIQKSRRRNFAKLCSRR